MPVGTQEQRTKSFRVFERVGRVENVQVRSRTEVSSSTSGGGGYVQGGYGYISAPNVSVSSRTITTQRIFVRDENGSEWHFDVGEELPVRPGHTIRGKYLSTRRGGTTLISISNLDNQRGWTWPLGRHLPGYRWVWLIAGLLLAVALGLALSMPPDQRLTLGGGSDPVLTIAMLTGLGSLIAVAVQALRRSFARNTLLKALGEIDDWRRSGAFYALLGAIAGVGSTLLIKHPIFVVLSLLGFERVQAYSMRIVEPLNTPLLVLDSLESLFVGALLSRFLVERFGRTSYWVLAVLVGVGVRLLLSYLVYPSFSNTPWFVAPNVVPLVLKSLPIACVFLALWAVGTAAIFRLLARMTARRPSVSVASA